MRMIIKVSSVFVLLIMAVSCATTPRAIPEKYNLDNELESVDKIFTIREQRWQEVDDQSIIIRTDRRTYYLLVLRRPMDKRYSIPRFRLLNTSYVTPGFDRIHVRDNTGTQYYDIDKIYRLKGREQAEEIKERLSES